MSYIPFNDFQAFFEKHSEFIADFYSIFDHSYRLQAKALYKRFNGRFEQFKNAIHVCELYRKLFGCGWYDREVLKDEVREIIVAISPMMKYEKSKRVLHDYLMKYNNRKTEYYKRTLSDPKESAGT